MPRSARPRRSSVVVCVLAMVAALLGVLTAGAGAAGAATQQPGTYVAVTPTRLLDTRSGLGAAEPAAQATLALQVIGNPLISIPDASAVVLNVTVTQPTAPGYLTVYADGTVRPVVSNLNFSPGQTVANLVVVPVTDGSVDIFNGAAGPSQVIADISGYYTSGDPAVSGALVPVTPTRVMDTRTSTAIAGGGTRSLLLGGNDTAGIPQGVSAVLINVTVTQPKGTGYLTAYPDGETPPGSSNLDFVAGQTVPNLVVVPLGADGKVAFHNGSTRSVQVVVDAFGYYAAGAPANTGALGPLSPNRLLDTRIGLGGNVVPANSSIDLLVDGRGGVPVSGVAAVVLNLTVTQPARQGYLTAYAGGSTTRPTVSNLDFLPGQTVPNLVLAPVGPDGTVTIYNGSAGNAEVIADVDGYVLAGDVAVPAADTSRFVRNLSGANHDPTSMNQEGCTDAEQVGSGGPSLMLLDIGAQTVTAPLSPQDPGVALSATSVRLDYPTLVTDLDAYVAGYAGCRTGSAEATIAVGTNSDGDFTAYPATQRGTDWAADVVVPMRTAAVADTALQVVGADDIEAGFAGSLSDAHNWISAYVAGTNAPLIENGSADGCPTAFGTVGQPCAPVVDDNGATKIWQQSDYYSLAHGASAQLVAVPQIFSQAQAAQWALIDQTGATASDRIDFVATLTESATCTLPSSNCTSVTPAQGFAALYDALSAGQFTAPSTLLMTTDLRIDS